MAAIGVIGCSVGHGNLQPSHGGFVRASYFSVIFCQKELFGDGGMFTDNEWG